MQAVQPPSVTARQWRMVPPLPRQSGAAQRLMRRPQWQVLEGAVSGIAIGVNASASGRDAVAMGSGAEAATNAIALGHDAKATGNQSISIGTGNVVSGDNSGAIGDPTTINAANSYSVGNNNTLAVGADNSFVLGNDVNIGENISEAVALGNASSVTQVGGVALGANSVASTASGAAGYDPVTGAPSTDPSATWQSTASAVSVGDAANGVTRQITGVAAGAEDTDAVNVAQLKASKTHYYSVNDNGVVQSNYNNDGAINGVNALAAGPNAVSDGNSSVAVGDGARTASIGAEQVAVGAGALAGGNRSIAIGSGARASTDLFAGGVETVAIGNGASAEGTKNVALGSGSVADGSTLTDDAYSPTGDQNDVVGINPASEVSVGSAGSERRITNVAAGSADTDAVNVSQLKAQETALVDKGFNITADNSGLADPLITEDNVKLGESVKYTSADGNIVTTFGINDNEIDFDLADNLVIGDDTAPGSIIVKGEDGVDGAVGIDGKNGTIGLTGPMGPDGAPAATIGVADGVPGVAGEPGVDGITRIVYEGTDQDGNPVTETVATLSDGLRFSGNDNPADGFVTRKLNEEMQIVGGAKATNADGSPSAYSSDNIRTVAIQGDGIEIQLAESPTFGGDLTVEGDTYLGDNFSVVNNEAFYDGPITNDNSVVNKQYVDNQGDASAGGGFGFADATDTEVKQDLGATIKVHDPDGDIITTADKANGELQLSLSNDLSVGEAGPAGEDGYIGVDGKDGISGVAINGKDGSIGLTGPSGTNGTISVIDGKAGVNGVDGVDGITRIVIDDIEVATMEDGLKFSGNDNPADGFVTRKLNEELQIVGGATATNADGSPSAYSSDNIRTVATQDGGIEIQLAESPTFGGDLTVEGDTYLGDNFSVVNNEAFYDGPITNDNSVVNKKYVDNQGDASAGGGFGLADATDTEVKQDLGATIKVHDPDGDIITTADNANGELQLSLSNDLSVGEAGPAGEDGYIGVDGKDGISGVAINGKDGSIGLTGPSGTNGTISVIDGKAGVNGVDGVDGITRIVIDDIEVATMEDGLKFSGNDNPADGFVTRKLNEELQIVGGAKATNADGSPSAYSSDNIRTVATQDGGIEIQLAESPTFGGDLTVEGDTYLGDNFSVVNNEAFYDGPIANDNSVVNKQYVDGIETHYYSVNDGGTQQDNYANDGASGVDSLAAGVAASTGSGADRAVALGYNTSATGVDSIAIGQYASATAEGSVAIGRDATANGGKSISIGYGNTATGDGAVSIGDPSTAIGAGALALGKDNYAEGTGAVALGNTNTSEGDGALAIGDTNTSSGNGAITMGVNNQAIGEGAVAMGNDNMVTGDGAFAVGNKATSSALDTLALGSGASATSQHAMALGNSSEASGLNSFAAGNTAVASAENSMALGQMSLATGLRSSAIGLEAVASAEDAMSVGTQADASGLRSSAIGNNSVAAGQGSTALGSNADAQAFGSMAIGARSTAVHEQSIALGGASKTVRGPQDNYTAYGLDTPQTSKGELAIGQVAVFDENGKQLTEPGERQITGVAAGSADTDAVNVSQLKGIETHYYSVNDNGVIGGNYNNDGATGLNAISSGVNAAASGDGAVAMGFGASAPIRDSLALGSGSVVDRALAPDSGFIPAGAATIEYNTTDKELLGAISVGDDDSYRQITNVADGTEAQDAVTVRQLQGAVGSVLDTGTKYFHANSTQPDSAAVGQDSIAVGPTTVVNGDAGIGIGNGAIVGQMAPGGTAIGDGAEVMLSDGIAFGTNALSEAQQGIALGAGATVSHDQSVALGSNSVTAEPVATSGATIAGTNYNFAGAAPDSTVSVGDVGNERTITNVAAGRLSDDSTDAVNGSQLFASNQAIDEVSAVANAGWNVTDGTNAANIGPNGEVTFTGDSNLTVAQTGVDDAGQVDITLNRDLNLDSVVTGNSTLNNDGLAISDGAGNVTNVTNDGLTIAGGPSITASGGINANDQIISNVGAGAVGADSTDAINGSQLFDVADSVNTVIGGNAVVNPDGSITTNDIGNTGADTVHDAIASVNNSVNAGWNVTDGTNAANIGPNGEVTFTGDSNLTVAQTGVDDAGQVDITLNRDLDLDSVVTGNSTLNNDGLTVDDGAGNSTVVSTGGSSVTDAAGNNAVYDATGIAITDGDNSTTLTSNNLTVGGANPVVVDGDAGEVTGLTNTTYDPNNVVEDRAATEGQVDQVAQNLIGTGFNIAADNGADDNVKLGETVTYTNDDGNLVSTVRDNEVVYDLADDLNVASITADDGAGNVTQLSAADGVVVTDGTNTAVYDADGLSFVDAKGDQLEGTPSISQQGISAGNTKITDAAAGDISGESTDAINGSQLYATNQWIEALENSVTNVVGDGSDDYITNNGLGIRYVRTNDSGLAVSDAFAQGEGSTAVGYEAVASADRALAMGYDAIASHQGSVALGEGARTAEAIGTASVDIAGQTYQFAGASPVATVSVGSRGSERTITNVAAGRITADSTDAINGSQLYAAMDFMGSLDDRLTIVEGDTGGGGADGAVMYDRDDNGDINYDSVTLAGEDGTKLTNVADGDISNDSSDAINGSQLHDTNQNVANNTTNIVDNSQRITNNEGNIADNSQRITTNENSITDINETLGLGLNFGADEGDTVNRQLGDTVAITGDDNITTKTTDDGVQITMNRDLDVDSVTTGNTTVNNDGVSIKDGPSMTVNGIDAGGTTITNVAPGVNEGDAVNVGQMNELGRRFQNEIVNVHGRIDSVERNANAGSASAIAASTVPQAWMPGKSMIGVGAGTYGGESAVSVGISRLSDNGRWVIQGKVTGDSQSNFGAGIGAGWHW
ncbi:YadA-like family protein [Vreelandella venusta]|nr:YadA-like family protein [Halomonas venusta]